MHAVLFPAGAHEKPVNTGIVFNRFLLLQRRAVAVNVRERGFRLVMRLDGAGAPALENARVC